MAKQAYVCHSCAHTTKLDRAKIAGAKDVRCASCGALLFEVLAWLQQTKQHDLLRAIDNELVPPKPKKPRAKRDKSRLPLCELTGADPGRGKGWVG